MAVFEQMESVTDMVSFALFLNSLARDYRDNPDEWQNQSIGDYLESIAAWIRDWADLQGNNGFKQFENNGFIKPDKNGSIKPEKNGFTKPDKNGSIKPEKNGFTKPENTGFIKPENNEFIQLDLRELATIFYAGKIYE